MSKRSTPDNLSAIEKSISMLQLPPDTTSIITLDDLQAEHEYERSIACKELDEMAKQFFREDAERKRLWGNKYPPVLGAKPPEPKKPINRVKQMAKKRKKV